MCMADYKTMYQILCKAASEALDALPVTEATKKARELLQSALYEAEDLYIHADEDAVTDDAFDEVLKAVLADFAEREGLNYMLENERLQHDPSAAVPPDVDQRALELIRRYFADHQ